METFAVISVARTIPVMGALTTPAKKAAIPMIANTRVQKTIAPANPLRRVFLVRMQDKR
jgi:hypothetical protein